MAQQGCWKCIIITLNLIFGLVGLVFLGTGLYVKYGADDVLEKALNASFAEVQGLGDALGVQGYDGSSSFDLAELADILSPVVTVLMVFGAFLFMMLILGCIGICCKVKFALWLYAIIVIVLLLTQLLLVILFFTGALDQKVKNEMLDSIQKNYVASDSYDIYSVMWNVFHQKYECCGVETYEDFHGAEKWNRTRVVESDGVIVVVYLQTPFTCCKPDASDYHCAETPTEQTNFLNTGCFGQIWQQIDSIEYMVIGAIAVVLLLQALCAAGAIVIAVKMTKEGDYA